MNLNPSIKKNQIIKEHTKKILIIIPLLPLKAMLRLQIQGPKI